MVAYRFEDSRADEGVARHLNGYRGIAQVDGYAAYNKLTRSDHGNDGVTLAGCWSHSRRKFYELHVAESSKVATETVERMVWHVEEPVRGQSLDARVAVRQQTSAMIVTELFAPLAEDPAADLRQIETCRGDPLRHVASRHLRALPDRRPHRTRLQHCRARHQAPGNHETELDLRRQRRRGRNWATVATLLQTAKMNNVDPLALLTRTLERISNGWPSSKIDALMPWNYAA